MVECHKLYTDKQALTWAVDIARAIACLHSKSPLVIHRDLKSENIMFTNINGRKVAKLGDFGVHVVSSY